MSGMEIILPVVRGTHVASLASLFGSLVFLALVAAPAMGVATGDALYLWRRLLKLARLSAALALISGVVWLLMEASVIAGANSATMALHALPVVALRTQFGQWLLLRLALILVTLVLLRSRETHVVTATIVAAGVVAVQPMLGHAGAVGGSVGATLIVSEVIHLLAAGAWLGGLLPLFITIGIVPHDTAAAACRNFTPVGLSAVLLLGGTAVVQVAEFMGGLAGLFGTGYGQIALVKLALFIVLLTLAAVNRFALTDRLAEAAAAAARRRMRTSIAFEAVLGTLVVILAGFLASHTPGTHQQPVWPFAWRPSLDAMADPDLRREVIGALVAMGGGSACAMIAVLWRGARWLATAAAISAFLFAIPHLDLLLVPAYPTSFFTSPTEFAATAITHGEKLFKGNCAVCHGIDGSGDGPAAKALPIRPADLTAEHFWAHSDGDLFWYISHGIRAPDGGITMPGFSGSLSSEARWDLIDYLRAHNAGISMRTTGRWSHPLPVPQFDMTCEWGRTINADDLRGHMLRVVSVSGEEVPMPVPPTATDIKTIILSRGGGPVPTPGACVASEPQAWAAFAILLDVSSDALAGEQVLVDQNSWLRTVWRPGGSESVNPQTLVDTIRDIAAHPITVDATGAHAHRH
jgi:putative copper export protein/mono/diheme cytochrome c family protein